MRFEFGRDRVLVVEDDPEVQIALYRMLRREGYSVTLAPSRRDALWCLQAVPVRPAVILLDFLMRGLNGHEFRRHLDQNANWADVPIIVLPATRDVSADADAIGAIGTLRRPLDGRQLHGLLGQVLPHRTPSARPGARSRPLAIRRFVDPLCSQSTQRSTKRTACKSRIS